MSNYITPLELGSTWSADAERQDDLAKPYGPAPEGVTPLDVERYHQNFALAHIAILATEPLPPAEALLHLEVYGYLCANFDSRPYEEVVYDFCSILRRFLKPDAA